MRPCNTLPLICVQHQFIINRNLTTLPTFALGIEAGMAPAALDQNVR